MDVQVRILFHEPTEDDWRDMRLLANSLTNDPDSVRVVVDEKPEWLVAAFSMPTEAQVKAVDKIDRALRYTVENRQDSTICFRRLPAEDSRAQQKNERAKARRNPSRGED